MSKSIYKEALDILLNSLQDPQDEEDDCYMLSRNQMNKIYNTISQAQKQEKLLELYRKLITVKDDMFSYCEVADDDYYDMAEIEDDLEQRIKELEKWQEN